MTPKLIPNIAICSFMTIVNCEMRPGWPEHRLGLFDRFVRIVWAKVRNSQPNLLSPTGS